MDRPRATLFLASRAVLAGFLLLNAANHFRNTKMMSGYAASKRVPAPKLAVWGSGALLGLGGASILTGYRPRVGIYSTAGFFIGVTPLMHAYWKVEDPDQRMTEMVQFQKNAGLLGATLALAAIREPWPMSVDAMIERRARRRPQNLEGPTVQRHERRVTSRTTNPT